MTGRKLIEWAIEQCRRNNLPPTDANILMYIRQWAE
jgi:hypothetical protein